MSVMGHKLMPHKRPKFSRRILHYSGINGEANTLKLVSGGPSFDERDDDSPVAATIVLSAVNNKNNMDLSNQ